MSIKLVTIEIRAGQMIAPFNVSGKNIHRWAALCTGKNAANVERKKLTGSFDEEWNRLYDAAEITPNAVIEIGADHVSNAGHRYPDRGYYRVLSITPAKIEAEEWPTLAKAMKAARNADANSGTMSKADLDALDSYTDFIMNRWPNEETADQEEAII